MEDVHRSRDAPDSPSHSLDQRLTGGGVERGSRFEIVVDGRAVWAYDGETVAAALVASGLRTVRTTAVTAEPRGFFCGMGACFECVMIVDGIPNIRTCQIRARPGLRVESQVGHGRWKVTPR